MYHILTCQVSSCVSCRATACRWTRWATCWRACSRTASARTPCSSPIISSLPLESLFIQVHRSRGDSPTNMFPQDFGLDSGWSGALRLGRRAAAEAEPRLPLGRLQVLRDVRRRQNVPCREGREKPPSQNSKPKRMKESKLASQLSELSDT